MASRRASSPRLLHLRLVFVMALGMVWPPPACRADQAPGAVEPIATVGDTELTTADLDRMIRKRTLGRPVAPEQQRQIRAQAVRELIDETLLRAEIGRRRIVVEAAEVNERMALVSKELSARRSSIDEYRSQAGLDQAAFQRQIEFDLSVPKLVVPLIDAEVMKKVAADHHREFDGTRIRVSHIILRTDPGAGNDALPLLLERAEGIRRQILTGELTFAEAAERHSAGPSRRQGGDLGFVPRHGLLAEEFTRQAFNISKGEISKPFTTPLGVHIVTVTDIDEGKIEPERFRNQLSQIAFQRVLSDLLKQCHKRTEIKLAPGVEMAEPRTSPQPANLPPAS